MRSPRSRSRTLIQIGTALVISLTARASLADHYRVPSGSMEPTVHVGDHIVVSKIAYGVRLPLTDVYLVRFASPARGDVVVLELPESGERSNHIDSVGAVLLKRVVAVEGDIVEVKDGRVRINEQDVDEQWVSTDEGGGPDLGPVRVPPGKLLVLGDNRGNSRDGRMFGWVERDDILGKAIGIVARDGRPTYTPLR